MFEIIFTILYSLASPVIPIVIIVAITRYRKNSTHGDKTKGPIWFTKSTEDLIHQTFLMLSLLFFSITLYAVNRDFGSPTTGQTITLIFAITAFFTTYYFKTPLTLIAAIIGGYSWWGAQALEWIKLNDTLQVRPIAVFAGGVLLTIIYYLLGQYHEKKEIITQRGFGTIYTFISLYVITIALFNFSSREGARAVNEMAAGADVIASIPLTISLLFLTIAAFCGICWLIKEKVIGYYHSAAILFIMFIFTGLLFIPHMEFAVIQVYPQPLTTYELFWAILFNVLLFSELLGVIILGYLREKTWLVNFGVIFIFIFTIAKYFDWFFSFLDRSIFFIGTGILFFIVGWFMERGRKMVIKKIETK